MYNDEWLKKLAKTSDNVISWDESEKFAQDELIKHYKVLKYHVIRMLYPTDIAWDTRFGANPFERIAYDAEAMIHSSIKDIDLTLQFLKVANEKRKDYTTQLNVLVHNPEKEISKDV